MISSRSVFPSPPSPPWRSSPGCSLQRRRQIPWCRTPPAPTDYPVCDPPESASPARPRRPRVSINGLSTGRGPPTTSVATRAGPRLRPATRECAAYARLREHELSDLHRCRRCSVVRLRRNTTALTDGDATLTANATAGDNSGATATGTLHVDNVKPVIRASPPGPPSTTITAGPRLRSAFLHACHRQRDHHRRKRRRILNPDSSGSALCEPRRHDYVHCASDQPLWCRWPSRGHRPAALTSPCRSSHQYPLPTISPSRRTSSARSKVPSPSRRHLWKARPRVPW